MIPDERAEQIVRERAAKEKAVAEVIDRVCREVDANNYAEFIGQEAGRRDSPLFDTPKRSVASRAGGKPGELVARGVLKVLKK